MASMIALSVVDRGFERRSGQTKDYNKNVYIKISAQDVFLE